MPELMLREMGEDESFREAMTVEISEEQVQELKIGQRVTVTIEGSVGMLQIPPEGASESDPPLLGIRVSEKSVQGKNDFEALSEDAEKDGE